MKSKGEEKKKVMRHEAVSAVKGEVEKGSTPVG